METETLHLMYAIVIIASGACVQGIIGFGSGLVAMSLIPLFWEIPYAVGVLSPLGVALTVLLAYRLRAYISWTDIRWLLVPMPFGVVAGIWILTHWPNEAMKALLGVLLMGYVLYSLKAPEPQNANPRPMLGSTAGFFSGLCSGALGTGGPPILIYASTVNWPRDRFRGNLQGFFVTTATLTFIGQVNAGLVTSETITKTAAIVPGLIVGALTGNKLASRIPQALFRKVVLAVLGLMGLLYLSDYLL
ncbi:MAG: sulfite exporter TauE/SafE family protein [Myxococcota bacterium]|nr:sulfite exporter TauE/SafE family protein [Myxococcota bacterium]